MPHFPAPAAALAVALLCAAPGSARAGERPSDSRSGGGGAPAGDVTALADDLLGSYRFAGGKAERKARDAAIEDVVDRMSFLVRGIARGRLRRYNEIPERVTVQRRGDRLVVLFDGRGYTAPLDGSAVKVIGVTGDQMELRLQAKDGALRESFVGEEGGRVNAFRRDGDTLHLDVTVFSDKLPKDLEYRLTYRRED